jgi:transcriptional regulator GlxA family with amidase domain
MPGATRVAVLAFDGCMTSAVAGILDAFAIANRVCEKDTFRTRVLGRTSMVQGSCGFAIHAEPLDTGATFDLAIVPPIMADVPETLAANGAIVTWLAQHAILGHVAASVCTGAFFLGAAGLLANRRATTNPIFAPAFKRAYPDTTLVIEQRIVDEGRIVSAGSTTAFLDLVVYLVDRFSGHATAVMTAKALSIDKNHPSQVPYFLPFAERNHGDATILALQTWMEEEFAKTITSAELARRAKVSMRSLNRRFVEATGLTPTDYLHRVRIEVAKRLLETTNLNVQEITVRVGYQDARSFSRLFRVGAGLSPRGYRDRFGATSNWAARIS